MGDGQVYSNENNKVRKPCLRAAISRTLSGPDDEDRVEAYESSLRPGWHRVHTFYQEGCVVKSICPKTKAQTTLHPVGVQDLCDLFAFEALEGREIRVYSACGKSETVGPFYFPQLGNTEED